MPEFQRRLFLVRHAQGSLGSDDYDQLSPTGFRQAEYIAAHLDVVARNSAVIRGELKRHRQTAEYLHRPDECHTDANLNEYRVDHLLKAAFDRANRLDIPPPDPEAIANPANYLQTFLALFPRVLEAWQTEQFHCTMNGRWSAFSARVEAAGQRLAIMLDECGTVVAVTSAGVISTLAASLLGRDLAWQRELNVTLYNASVSELRLSDAGHWQVTRLNCVAHLPAGDLRTLA